MIDIPTTIAFITYVRPYVEPYVEPLLWRSVSWVLGNVERPSDAVREVELFKQREREKEGDVMQALGPYIHHEKQEPGSMMCGQHALNTLLQGSYFTSPDLIRIAKEVGDPDKDSIQGIFSAKVLENGLKNTFGLTLTSWKSPEMKVFQAYPETQLAFVLNLQQHWFTIRRFGRHNGKGIWFNLNSFLPSPEWVGSNYLVTVLQKAEQEGYAVYVVRPSDPTDPEHSLPDTEADLLAETLEEPAPATLSIQSSSQVSTSKRN